MSGLYLLRFPVHAPRLLRFAAEQGITQEDETLGYTLHAWLAALFGEQVPKPFRYIDRRNELLAYAAADAATLLAQAQAFASPQAWAALDPEGVASKPMPEVWRQGKRLHLEVLTCPVARKDMEEKDVYLRALDRLGDKAPPRGEVYRDWFIAQLADAVRIERVELLGMQARSKLLRRARNGQNRLRVIERPQALFGADVVISNPARFAELLTRGIGRHRAFGFGMVLLSPPR
ncbi:MAG: type I-E CRISPR-associated protein Cas6/Cse3/CasE [Sulfuriferula sp.]